LAAPSLASPVGAAGTASPANALPSAQSWRQRPQTAPADTGQALSNSDFGEAEFAK